MQTLANGFISGAAIAVLAVAFQVVYLPTRVFFIGLAGVYCLAPFLAKAALGAGWGWVPAAFVSVSGCVSISVLCEWANHARLARREASEGAHLVASLGTYIVIVQTVALIWGNNPSTLRVGLDSANHVGSVVITGAQWVTVSFSAAIVAILAIFLTCTGVGLKLRALADNPSQLVLYGYNLNHYRLLAFGTGGLLAAASSLLNAYDIGFDASTGLHPTLLAVVAVILGGRTSFFGPAAAGVVLGVLRAETVWYWSARWQETITFGLLGLVLLLRPQGLFSARGRLDVAP